MSAEFEKLKGDVDKYSFFSLKQLRSDYQHILIFLFYFIAFLIPSVLTYIIFHYADSHSKWIGFGFFTGLWAVVGLFLLIRPVILRIIIPMFLFILQMIIGIITIFQVAIVTFAEYIEKQIKP